MKLKFLDLKKGYEELKPEIDSAIMRILDSGQFILGEELLAFEQERADFCGTKYSVGAATELNDLILGVR